MSMIQKPQYEKINCQSFHVDHRCIEVTPANKKISLIKQKIF